MKNIAFPDFKLFSGNSHRELAEEIAKIMGKPLSKAEVKKFSDGEISVSIGESVRGFDCFIIQSTCDPVNDNLMEVLIMMDAFKRASAGRINVVIPYYGYARQDRKAKARDPITAKLVADLLEAAGADRVITMDLHAAQIQGVITRRLIRFENVVEAAAGKKLRFHDFQNFVRMFQTPGVLEDFPGEHLRQKHHGVLIQISSAPAFSVDESRQAEFGR